MPLVLYDRTKNYKLSHPIFLLPVEASDADFLRLNNAKLFSIGRVYEETNLRRGLLNFFCEVVL